MTAPLSEERVCKCDPAEWSPVPFVICEGPFQPDNSTVPPQCMKCLHDEECHANEGGRP
jgi:hypothetical protein